MKKTRRTRRMNKTKRTRRMRKTKRTRRMRKTRRTRRVRKTRMTRRTMKTRRMMVMEKMKMKTKVKDDDEDVLFYQLFDLISCRSPKCRPQRRGPNGGETATAVKALSDRSRLASYR